MSRNGYGLKSYCSNHENSCGTCQKRIAQGQYYCSDHRYNCQKCSKKISRINSYCTEHVYEGLEGERNKVNNLQTQLNTVNNRLTTKQQEIEWLKNQLKMEIGDEEYQARIEENYPQQFRN